MTAGALHPWNTSFEWRRLGIEPRRLTSDQVESFHRTGWLVVEDLLEQAMVTDLTADLDTIEEGPCGYTYGASGDYTLSATTTWLLPYTSSAGAGSLAPMDRTSTFDYTVREIQTVGVGG